MDRAGFYGKLPSRGDFVGRRLPPQFVGRWDSWLQQGLAAAQSTLGPGWLDIYLTSPIWRFALAPNVCGPDAYVGVVIPSVDRVGRYFPLTSAVALPPGAPPAAAFELDAWYAQIEALLLATLGDETLDLDVLDMRLANVALPDLDAWAAKAPVLGRDALNGDTPVRRHCTVSSVTDAPRGVAAPLSAALAPLMRYSLWWTQGSERVAPCVLVSRDLPDQQAFVALLDGAWEAHGWTSEPQPRSRRAGTRSAAVSDPGKTRKVNEDSYACRDDLGAFIVADGLGGHQAGDVASRMVASVVEELGDARNLAERTDRLVRALRVVNGCLLAFSAATRAAGLAGSTVAALLVDGAEIACVWAGDSRIYRWRDGALVQLSHDHSDDDGSPGNRAVTRAVGGVPDLELDVVRSDARAGDRYLLCSDGLYGELDAQALERALALDDPALACEQLKAAVLAGAANDNLTAVVVHVAAGGLA